MNTEQFKEVEKIYKDIEQIKGDLDFLKQCECCRIHLYKDLGSQPRIKELHSIPSSVIYNFIFEYLNKKLVNLEKQFNDL